MSTADVASHLCYGVVFDPAHFQGQEDLPAKNTQFLDDGSDPGRTPEGTVSLSILSPKGKVNPKTKTGQRTAYSSPSETVYFTRPLVLSPNVTTPLASAFKPCILHWKTHQPPLHLTWEIIYGVSSLSRVLNPEVAFHLSGQHAFACTGTALQALSSPDSAEWSVVIDAEIDGLVEKGMVPIPVRRCRVRATCWLSALTGPEPRSGLSSWNHLVHLCL